jgi:hypothetical protein
MLLAYRYVHQDWTPPQHRLGVEEMFSLLEGELESSSCGGGEAADSHQSAERGA